jgi:HEAT repeat protein
MYMLASREGATRQKARESLIALGKPAVPSLTRDLRNSKLDRLRWEAAKSLCSINDTRAIPSLVKVLEDSDHDVAWLAAVALRKFKKAAWPQLLNMLIKGKPDSSLLRQGADNDLRNQREDGFNELLTTLTKSSEPGAAQESTAVAAYNILKQMKEKL